MRLEPGVERLVDEVVQRGAAADAAFDADGTIWAGDIGEELLRELVQQRRLIDPPPENPYGIYERLFCAAPSRAFSFCVEVMRGLPVAEVERWSDEIVRRHFAAQVFPSIRGVLDRLLAAGVRVWIVSASNAVTVRRAARALGLDEGRVLAVEGAVDRLGCFTGQVLPPVTCSAGKVEALMKKLGGRRPEIAFGNSLFDREMLEHAHRAVMVAPEESEGLAVKLARERTWPVHRVQRSH
ncbi:MAG: HAD-IB family phosphatase [Deltaproteobacteria bacterium]|nr:HAD-IB family phosphatase [Deltaproteobacteria bacterium]